MASSKHDSIILNLRHCFKYVPGCIYYKNLDGYYLACSDYMIHESGFKTADDLIGKTDYDLFSKEQADKLRDNDLQVVREEKTITTEEAITLFGSVKYFEVIKVPFRDSDGSIIGIIGNSVDITDRKRAEQLQKEKAVAERISQFSNLVAGSIAHEIRTPLTGINLKMDMLNDALPLAKSSPDKEFFCKQIINEVKLIVKSSAHVISDMLLKVRSFATGKLHYQDFTANSIAADVEEFLAAFPFEYESDKELIKLKGFDSLSGRFKYSGDHVLTQHVLSNLLRNSLHAIKTERKGDVTIELQCGNPFNKLIFRDTASGIASDYLPKIFDQFETKKTTHGGTGLGLAFCKMVMQEYGGNISCDSKEGEFTEFTLCFPTQLIYPKTQLDEDSPD